MKKLILLTICCLFVVNCDSNSVEMISYEKNKMTAKKFYQSFADKKLDQMRSFVTDDYTWSPPPTGVDSLDVETWLNSMKGFNNAFNNIEFTEQLYFRKFCSTITNIITKSLHKPCKTNNFKLY